MDEPIRRVLANKELWCVACGNSLDVLATMLDQSIHCVVTSVPYYMQRDYGHKDQIGIEKSPEEYVGALLKVFRQVRRVLRNDGTCWVNLGESWASTGGHTRNGESSQVSDRSANPERNRIKSYSGGSGVKVKDIIGIPWLFAFAMRADGWYLRDEIIWQAPNKMPGSQQDRTTRCHEQVFLFSKKPRYYFDGFAIREPAAQPPGNPRLTGQQKREKLQGLGSSTLGSNEGPSTRTKRSVWSIPTKSSKAAHYAMMPEKLVMPCIMAGTSDEGVCAECGQPLVRIVDRKRIATRPGRKTKLGDTTDKEHGNRDPERHVTEVTHVGWKAWCECGAEKVPAICLDPFGGSGTTVVVARKLGRRGICIDLNESYCKIAEARIERECPAVLF